MLGGRRDPLSELLSALLTFEFSPLQHRGAIKAPDQSVAVLAPTEAFPDPGVHGLVILNRTHREHPTDYAEQTALPCLFSIPVQVRVLSSALA